MVDIAKLGLNTLFLYLIVLDFFLASFIIFRNPKKKINQSFSLLCFVLSVWILSLFASQVLHNNTLLWLKIGFFSQIIIILNAFYLSFIYPVQEKQLTGAALIFGTAYFLSFSALLFFTPFWLEGMPGSLSASYGNGYLLFLTISWIPIAWTVLNLYQKLAKTVGLEKTQLKYILGSFLFWALNANFLAHLFSLMNNQLAWLAFSGLASLVFSATIFYAIARYRLLDIRLIVAKAIVYGLLALVVTVGYALCLFIFGLYFYQTQLSGANLAVSLSLTLLVALTVVPVKKSLEKITDRTLLKDKLMTDQALVEFTNLFFKNASLKNLATDFSAKLRTVLNLEKVYFLLKDQHQLIIYPEQPVLEIDYQKITKLIDTKESMLVFDDLPEGQKKDEFRKINIYCLSRHVTKDYTALVFLGFKHNGEIYFEDDINFLKILLPQFFIALERVMVFERLRHFNQILKVKVKEAVSSLGGSNQKLRQALNLKNEVLSIISHELVVPMVAISGSLITILEGYTGKINTKTREFIQAVNNENTRLIRLTKNLLNISRIRTGRLKYQSETFNPAGLIKEVIDLMQPLAVEKRLQLKMETALQVKTVADRDKLKEILINLIDNAIRYSSQGTIKVGYRPDGKQVQFYVQDNGQGIKPSEKRKLFCSLDLLSHDRVLTRKSRGLGLYICQSLLKGMKGKIDVKSQPNQGTVFFIQLPKG